MRYADRYGQRFAMMTQQTSHSEPRPGRDEVAASGPGPEPLPEIEPMTFSLLGRFFVVPLVIIGAIVGGAVLVVVLFGGTSAPDDRSLDELLTALETNSGERSMGILLPREKELWQTALELSVRLKAKDKEKLTSEQLQTAATRLSAMVKADLANLDRISTSGSEAARQRDIRSNRLEFMVHALGRTEQPIAVETLIDIVRQRRKPCALAAMQELADLHKLPAAHAAVEPITSLLREPGDPESRLVACTALSVLATPADREAIDALTAARLADDGEVAWSAGLALARLGSSAGKTTLLDLLDRSFLSAGDRYHTTDSSGAEHRYPMPPARIDQVMIAAVDAGTHLSDPDLWAAIGRLQSDPSPAVRAKAQDAMKGRDPARAGDAVED